MPTAHTDISAKTHRIDSTPSTPPPRDHWDFCPDCGCEVNEPHRNECDVERCSICGTQRVSCGGCRGHDPEKSAWTGEWPESRPSINAQSSSPSVIAPGSDHPIKIDMDELRQYLSGQKPGPLNVTSEIERLLAGVWDDLGGDGGGMAGCKLISRMEQVEWHPPALTFRIERHGGTVLGSTRAEMQRWSVDLDSRTATLERTSHRQLSPTAGRVDVAPIAAEIAELIVGSVIDERLQWNGYGRVRVLMGYIFPQGSGFKQTVQGRRRRLRESLIEALGKMGWEHLGGSSFVKGMS